MTFSARRRMFMRDLIRGASPDTDWADKEVLRKLVLYATTLARADLDWSAAEAEKRNDDGSKKGQEKKR